MVNAVNWFEVPVTDLSRAKAFDEAALGYVAFCINCTPE